VAPDQRIGAPCGLAHVLVPSVPLKKIRADEPGQETVQPLVNLSIGDRQPLDREIECGVHVAIDIE